MRLFAKFLLAAFVNAAALLLANAWINGFMMSTAAKDIAVLAATLTVLNFFLRPILRVILAPVIILTLGLGAFLVNALVLYILDFLAPSLSIQTAVALALATLIVSVCNFIFHLATRRT